MSWFETCNHDWEVKSKDILPSAYEQMTEQFKSGLTEGIMLMFKKKLVVILACKKCGDLDKTVEENP